MRKEKLENLVSITTGQMMSRVKVKLGQEDSFQETRKVLIPKTIENGRINHDYLAEEKLANVAEKERLSEAGQIVMKLSAPYDAAIITEEDEGLFIPSFCAKIENKSDVDMTYVLAFLNSSYCKDLLKAGVAGSPMAVLSVGKIKSLEIPIPESFEQKIIGSDYIKTINNIKILSKIVSLEQIKNDLRIIGLVK